MTAAAMDLDAPCACTDLIECNLRYVLLHMIEETAHDGGDRAPRRPRRHGRSNEGAGFVLGDELDEPPWPAQWAVDPALSDAAIAATNTGSSAPTPTA